MSTAGPPRDRRAAPTSRSTLGGQRATPFEGDHPPFRFSVRVYYEDTDAAGVVYYANYLKYMERARTEWLESLGLPLAAFEREHGVVFVVHRCEIDFLQPARLNDALEVSVERVKLGAATIKARQDVRRESDVLTSALVSLACLDAARWQPVRVPPVLAARLENPA